MYMSRRFRISSLVFALILLLAAFMSGCGSSKAPESGTTTAGTTAGQSPAATEATTESPIKEFVKLTWYMPPPIDPQPNKENVMAEINRQLKEKINAELEFQFIDWGSYNDKMKLMAAAGDPYDICFATSWINFINLNVARGAFLELDDLLEKYGQDILRVIDERWWPAVTYNGKRYAIPNPSNYAQGWGFVFKKDLVEKYNFDYKSVNTLQKLEPYLELIKQNEPEIIPLAATTSNTPGMDFALEYDKVIANIMFDPQTGQFLPAYECTRQIEKWKLLSEWYKKGYINKDAATKSDYQAEGRTGKYAVMSTTGSYSEDGSKSSAAYGFPCVESFIGNVIITTNSVTSAANAISKTSKNPERAMMLLNLMFGDKKFLNLCSFGIEGQDYEVVEGKGTDNPTIKLNSPHTWAVWTNWLGDLYQSYPAVNGNTAEALKQMYDDCFNSPVSQLLGFIFDSEPVKNECAQLDAINTEFGQILITGTNPDVDAYLKQFKERSEKAGIAKVMAEVERQYNAWKAANAK